MGSFENFKESAINTAGKVADKSVEIARTVGDKAKIVGKIAKLRTEVAMEKDSVKKAYVEIGKLYYQKHKNDPETDMAQIIAEVSVSLEAVNAKTAEILALKKELADDFGDFTETAAEKAEDIADDVKETVEDVVEKVADAVDGE